MFVTSSTGRVLLLLGGLSAILGSGISAQATIRIMPPERAAFAVGQRFDLRVEATAARPEDGPPSELRVFVDGREITRENILDPGVGGERGVGGTGILGTDVPARERVGLAPSHTTNFLVREWSFQRPGLHRIRATTSDGVEHEVVVSAVEWEDSPEVGPTVRNVILLLGDGMSLAHRTAARIVARGVRGGKADGLLAMDGMEATGLVMTFSLNSVITDSAPGMAALSTGQKANNNQLGVYPDNTLQDAFDNPRVEYLGEFLRRRRGPGFRVGLVTTADVTDATPAANAVHTARRDQGEAIAERYFDERGENGVTVLLGGGARRFIPEAELEGGRRDGRHLADEFRDAGYERLSTAAELNSLLDRPQPPEALLGLFHPGHMNVSFDKLGAGGYSRALEGVGEALLDQPMLPEMTRLALRTLEGHASEGFYLMVEGASIDKQAHAADAERSVWDVIEFDGAVEVALEFAARTNNDDIPDNETLVLVASDHETGGIALVGVGNERFEPATLGRSVRDYAAVFRFRPEQELELFPNYMPGPGGFPVHPDPSRKLLIGWAAAPDRYENWISNRFPGVPATYTEREGGEGAMAVANPARDGAAPGSDNETVDGQPLPGFLVHGIIEDGEVACPTEDGCPADTGAVPQVIAGHTASDVPISASGPGALLFTGTYDNTEVFLRILRALGGARGGPAGR